MASNQTSGIQGSGLTGEETLSYMRGLDVHFEHDVTGYPVFYVHGMSGDQKRDEAALESIVRLFSAAPDLLGAAKRIAARARAGVTMPTDYLALEAAITKAEGRS